MLPILKEYFASRLFLKVNISSACRDYKYIPYPSLEVQSSVRDIRQKSKLDCNDHCQNSQRCPPSQHPLCWLTITTMVLAMGGGWRKGGGCNFFPGSVSTMFDATCHRSTPGTRMRGWVEHFVTDT